MPQCFENIKRTALVLKPRQPFHDWLLSVEPGEDFRDALKEDDVYLLPDYEEINQMQYWLKRILTLYFHRPVEQLVHG